MRSILSSSSSNVHTHQQQNSIFQMRKTLIPTPHNKLEWKLLQTCNSNNNNTNNKNNNTNNQTGKYATPQRLEQYISYTIILPVTCHRITLTKIVYSSTWGTWFAWLFKFVTHWNVFQHYWQFSLCIRHFQYTNTEIKIYGTQSVHFTAQQYLYSNCYMPLNSIF